MAEESKAPSKMKGKKKKEKQIDPEGILKAMVREGEGDFPSEGDLVVFHCTTRTENGTICESTRKEHGGKGFPKKIILGVTETVPAWEFGLSTTRRKEISVLKVKPENHYGNSECQVSPPDCVPKNELLFFEIELLDFFSSGKDILGDGTILKHVEREGRGWEQAREPYEVVVRLEARVSGGEKYFSSPSLPFVFGKNQVPQALESAVASMLRDEIAIFHVSNCHVSSFLSLVPAGRVGEEDDVAVEGEWEVELLRIVQVRDVLGEGSVIKRRIRDGKGEFPIDCPLEDSRVKIHLRGILPEKENFEFLNTRKDKKVEGAGEGEGDGEPMEVETGEGLLPEALDMSVRLMVPGEIASVTSVAKYAYDNFQRPENIPEGATVEWEVELISFQQPKQWDNLSFEEIMEEANRAKERGNQVFKNGRFALARSKYEKVLRELQNVHPHSDEETQILDSIKVSLQLNISASWQREGESNQARIWADKVLAGNPGHPKALYRRGVAQTFLGNFSEAREDLEMMLKLDSSTESDAKTALSRLRKIELESEKKAKKQFGGLFDKKPGELSLDDPLILSSEKDKIDNNVKSSGVTGGGEGGGDGEEKEIIEGGGVKNEKDEGKEEKDNFRKETINSVYNLSGFYNMGKKVLYSFGSTVGRCDIL